MPNTTSASYKNFALATLSLVTTIAGSALMQSQSMAAESPKQDEFQAQVLEIHRSPLGDLSTLGVVKN